MSINKDNSLLDKMAMMRPMEESDIPKVLAEAHADGHTCPFPTHVIHKGEEIVGAVSMGTVPMIMAWMHTARCTPRDSLNQLSVVESILKSAGAKTWCFPCTEDSPFYKVLEALGYEKVGDVTLFIKKDN